MTDAASDASAEPTAAERWSVRFTEWADRFPVPHLRPADRDLDASVATRWTREVLPSAGGTLLDVGCRHGAASLAIGAGAGELIGVDPRGARLDEFVAAAAERGIARRTFHGYWPDVAAITPVADVAVCHHLLHRIADLAPFVVALTARARLAVVVEVADSSPAPCVLTAAEQLGVAPPPDLLPPLASETELIAVLRELGLDPESERSQRAQPDLDSEDGRAMIDALAERTGDPDRRRDEVAAALASAAAGAGYEVLTLRWPGAAEGMI